MTTSTIPPFLFPSHSLFCFPTSLSHCPFLPHPSPFHLPSPLRPLSLLLPLSILDLRRLGRLLFQSHFEHRKRQEGAFPLCPHVQAEPGKGPVRKPPTSRCQCWEEVLGAISNQFLGLQGPPTLHFPRPSYDTEKISTAAELLSLSFSLRSPPAAGSAMQHGAGRGGASASSQRIELRDSAFVPWTSTMHLASTSGSAGSSSKYGKVEGPEAERIRRMGFWPKGYSERPKDMGTGPHVSLCAVCGWITGWGRRIKRWRVRWTGW